MRPYRETDRGRPRGRVALRRPARLATASCVRTLLARRRRIDRLETATGRRTARFRRSSISPGRGLGRAGGARPSRRPLRRARAAAAARRPRSRARALDGAGARRRRLPGRGRADPRGRDRVGALPLPRRRRPDPAPRRPPLLQAPRSRARGRGRDARRRARRSPRAPAPPVPSRTGSPTRTPARRRSGSRPTAELARARTILLELERAWSHLNDIAAVCAGVGLAAGNARFAALDRAGAAAERAAHRAPLPLRHGRRRRQRARLDAPAVAARARRARRDPRTSSTRGWRELLFNASFQDRLPEHRRRHRRRRATARRGRPGRPRGGVAEDVRATSSAARLRGISRPSCRERAAGDVQARLEQRALELCSRSTLLDGLLDAPARAGRGGAGAAGARDRDRAGSRARAARRLRRRARGDRIERLRLRTGLVRELARPSPTPPPTTCCPTSR